MNRAFIEQQLEAKKVRYCTPYEWDTPSERHLRIWLQGVYGEVIERDSEYVERINAAETFQFGEVPTQFHRVLRYPKGQYKFDDDRILFFITASLEGYVQRREHTPYLDDETFGLLRVNPDWDRLCAQCTGWVALDVFEQREAGLTIDAELTGPTDSQKDWYKGFLGRQAQLKAPLEATILASYHELCERAGWQPSIATRDSYSNRLIRTPCSSPPPRTTHRTATRW